ncbi:hypothetical protein K439DRAFT_1660151 [Ramaria rubella]|nr:hypothetical protein K439DRAFT_1660151 [Ramaria rubella]
MMEVEQDREVLVQMLMSLQTGCDERYARQVLQKHNWNADQAAAALLDSITTSAEQLNSLDARSQRPNVIDEWVNRGALNATNPAPARPNSVIDLTGDDDDDETARALAASMETRPNFGPSNRIDDTQQWAMVPSNAPPSMSQEDHALNRALEASLSSSFVGASQEPYEEPSDPIERVRKDGWPTALRVTNSTICYAPIVLQCVLSLPKVYDRILRYKGTYKGTDEDHALAHQFQRLAANAIHTARAYMAVDELLDTFGSPAPISNQHSILNATRDYYMDISGSLESIPHQDDQFSDTPLMVFQGGNVYADVNEASSTYASGCHMDLAVPSPLGSDMVSCLAYSFSKSEVCLTELSECLAFSVRRHDDITLPGTERAPLKYPPRIYLDRFMQDNLELSIELRNHQEGMQHEIQKLMTDRQKLSNWKNEDTLKAVRSSVHYFEHLAVDGGDPKRKELHEQSKLKLLSVIKQIEANVQYLDTRIEQLTADVEDLFNNPDLQQHGYDLCAVIMHDGLFGRNHVYSYTKDQKGAWFKIVDYQISKVTEDMVLNDSTGLHLGAGPIFLMYSRVNSIAPALQEEYPRWPRIVKDLVIQENATFLAELPPNIASSFSSETAQHPLYHDQSVDDNLEMSEAEPTVTY